MGQVKTALKFSKIFSDPIHVEYKCMVKMFYEPLYQNCKFYGPMVKASDLRWGQDGRIVKTENIC